jgi:hypothetical protein
VGVAAPAQRGWLLASAARAVRWRPQRRAEMAAARATLLAAMASCRAATAVLRPFSSVAGSGGGGGGGNPAAAFTAAPQPVYDWQRDHCPGLRGSFETGGRCPNDVSIGCDPDVPDAPLRAFRNGSGSVVVLASVDLGSRALVGPSLASAQHTCAIYMNSTLDYKMADSADREWIQSPWVFPNGSIYALTHMEYHNRSNQAGLWSSVTLLKSTDGGQRWAHALPPPRHIVAAAPFKYEGPTSTPLYGFRSPSNILRSRSGDGLFYAFVSAGWGHVVRGQQLGTCLMRTADLTDPASWLAWDGRSFNVSLAVNPYLSGRLDASQHRCAPVTDMTYVTLGWSTFYQKYIAVGTSRGNDRLGWSFQLASDMANPTGWSEQVAIETGGYIEAAGNATHRSVPARGFPGMFARSVFENGTVGPKIWWLSPENATKHWNTLGCAGVCGSIPACAPGTLRNVPAVVLDAIQEGAHLGCDMLGALDLARGV